MHDDKSHNPLFFLMDDPRRRAATSQLLESSGYHVIASQRSLDATSMLGPEFPGVLIVDHRVDFVQALSLLRQVHEIDDGLPIIFSHAQVDAGTTRKLLDAGAYDVFGGPLVPLRVLSTVRRAMDQRSLVLENRTLRRSHPARSLRARLIGNSNAIESLRNSIEELAPEESNILLRGETGVGKELVAQCLHDLGPRRRQGFKRWNCAANLDPSARDQIEAPEVPCLSDRLLYSHFEQSVPRKGTLFLDRVDCMPLPAQEVLARALDRQLDRDGSQSEANGSPRIIASTSSDLSQAVAQGRFSADLYSRIAGIELSIPPLRQHREDIPVLFAHFVVSAARAHGHAAPPVTNLTIDRLLAHAWPSNVSELRQAAERHAVGMNDAIIGSNASENCYRSLAEEVEGFERSLIERCLADSGGRINEVMHRLQIPRRTLTDKMARFGLDRRRFLRKALDDSGNEVKGKQETVVEYRGPA